MSYLALARKYRPRLLSEVVGQDSVTNTLKQAMIQDKVHHAYIFTGTRGVGKTTLARIISMALNCQNSLEDKEPCLQCDSCKDILDFRHPDVIEIDAASNTGVDSIRDLIESAKYPPMIGKYKIYIIDEVHMLSKSAFNALLKTLEEPQHFIKFIFATTEYHKIPITIASRCQKFFLRNLNVSELKMHLSNILKRENIQYEDSAIEPIALSGLGSVRDSLSILDQVIAVSSGNININNVNSIINFGNKNYAHDIILNAILCNNEEVVNIANEAMDCGLGLSYIISNMLEIITKLMVCVSNGNSGSDIDLIINAMKKNDKFSLQILDRMWQIVAKTSTYQNINEAYLLRSLALRLSFIQNIPTIDEIATVLAN